MKKIFLFAFGLLALFISSVKTASAGQLKLVLSPLPSYEKINDFRVYYTYLETSNETATVNLYIQKEGKDWRQTNDKDKTSVSGYFQIQSTDLYDGEGKYNFYSQAVTSGETVNSATVSTTYDTTPPGSVSDYGKSKINADNYELKWKNPSDSDFERVYIYRSREKSFTADDGTKVGEVFGGPGESKVWGNGSLEDPNAEYYYAIRAVDRAGNASGVVTDAPGTVVEGSVAGVQTEGTPTGTGGSVVTLPKEEGETASPTEGQLGGGISTEEGEVKGEATQKTSKTPFLIGGAGLLLIVAFWYFYRKSKKQQLS